VNKVINNCVYELFCLLIFSVKSTGNEYYVVSASSKNSTKILVNYLDRHSLFSSKSLDYKD